MTVEEALPVLENIPKVSAKLETLVDVYHQAVQSGDADILNYYSAWSEWNAKQQEILDLRQQLKEAVIGLDIATGVYDIAGPLKPDPSGNPEGNNR